MPQALDALVEAKGICEVFGAAADHESAFGPYAERAILRLRKLIGAAKYAELLTDSCDQWEQKAAIQAGKRLGAAYFLRDRARAVESGRPVAVRQLGEMTETLMSVEEVERYAKLLANEAISVLDEAGIYQRPTNTVGRSYEFETED